MSKYNLPEAPSKYVQPNRFNRIAAGRRWGNPVRSLNSKELPNGILHCTTPGHGGVAMYLPAIKHVLFSELVKKTSVAEVWDIATGLRFGKLSVPKENKSGTVYCTGTAYKVTIHLFEEDCAMYLPALFGLLGHIEPKAENNALSLLSEYYPEDIDLIRHYKRERLKELL